MASVIVGGREDALSSRRTLRRYVGRALSKRDGIIAGRPSGR